MHVSTARGGCEVDSGENIPGADAGPGSNGTTNAPRVTYVVVAGEDGAVRFYDLKFRLEVRMSESQCSDPSV